MKELFKNHLDLRLKQLTKILEAEKEETLIIESGFPSYYFLDDQTTFFKPNPHFLFFCPEMGEGHILVLKKDSRPLLYYYSPNDFWHDTSSLQNEFWEECFEIKPFNDYNNIWKEIKNEAPAGSIISPHPESALKTGFHEISDRLLSQVHWMRISKSEYEIQCLKCSNEIAAKGHLAAKAAFFSGKSEYETNLEYLRATSQNQGELPYGNIVAFNNKAAILHYQKTRHDVSGNTFLIDAGARYHGYCSDITRTYFQSGVHSVFKNLHKKLDEIQLELCSLVAINTDYQLIQNEAHKKITELLCLANIITAPTDTANDFKLSHIFFPHGIGHALGLQVHDVGGKQADQLGQTCEQSKEHPFLRTLRTIQENDVLTIEPGIYFIPMLLNNLRSDSEKKSLINWKLVEELIPLGGIRIEDNIVAKKDSPLNLTRTFLPN